VNAAFFINDLKTEFFHAASIQLNKMGHDVFWISSSNTWSKWLRKHGVSKSKILNLSEYGPEWTGKKSLSPEEELELNRLEMQSEETINNLLLMDRYSISKLYPQMRVCLYVAAREFRRFMIENKIKTLFSEATWALELLAILICRSIGGKCYCPSTTRIPSNRFCFFESYRQSSVAFIRKSDEKDMKKAEEFLDYYLNNNVKPYYWYKGNKPPRPYLNWLKKYFKNLQRNNEDKYEQMRIPSFPLAVIRLSNVIKYRWFKYTKPFEDISLPPARPYVLYALHQQPESSIDVQGAFFSNQVELIKSIARSVPSTHDFYVKDHRSCIGERPLRFYKTIKSIPGVRLIDPFVDSHRLIKHADLVISVSGTIAYEAALFGRPAMSVANMYFGPILTVNGINPYRESFGDIFNCLSDKRKCDAESRRQNNIKFLAWLIAQSFEGIVSDSISNPECIYPENIKRVAQAMNVVLEKQSTDMQRLKVRSTAKVDIQLDNSKYHSAAVSKC